MIWGVRQCPSCMTDPFKDVICIWLNSAPAFLCPFSTPFWALPVTDFSLQGFLPAQQDLEL